MRTGICSKLIYKCSRFCLKFIYNSLKIERTKVILKNRLIKVYSKLTPLLFILFSQNWNKN
ncbi:hypothetical protein A0128_02670 [Leptospira tipperaryensis]|uniref:Uncharacterized protein n=1 Tax=Leptospira tipperaryensis TaxID=2564040 RepID=A0A1D7UTD0_9LEPT|nr:hypothetical protein A0128_02670 [Leptospira tipperaryensis]